MKAAKHAVWPIIIGILIIVFFPFHRALVFSFQNTEKILAYVPLKNKNNFAINYTHSIHLTDVKESYSITEKGNIRQYELMYENFGIGMPSNAEPGETFVVKDGKYYLKNMKQTFPYIDLKTGIVRANHILIFEGINYPMKHYIKPGTWVRIKFKKISVWQQMKGVNILECK